MSIRPLRVDVFSRETPLLRYYATALGTQVHDHRERNLPFGLGGSPSAPMGLGPSHGAPGSAGRSEGVDFELEVEDFDQVIQVLENHGLPIPLEVDPRTRLRSARLRTPEGWAHRLVEAPHAATPH